MGNDSTKGAIQGMSLVLEQLSNAIVFDVSIYFHLLVKLSDMFSGYGQSQSITWSVFDAVDTFLEEEKHRPRALNHIDEWDQGDVHRLVSTFLGVRFPMALALNKCDLPSSRDYVDMIQAALPVHGAHVGTPLSAKNEMAFVKNHLTGKMERETSFNKAPTGVWQCLASAMVLREPVLVFPVSDLTTYAPLLGMIKEAIENPSLPTPGMIRCIEAAGGVAPSCWSRESLTYVAPEKSKIGHATLRDSLLMKPGSTVEDVFLTLKRLGAISGEFVRAEGAGKIGEKSKPIPKQELMGSHNRIIKIMSTKRSSWQ